jgi:urease subunit beta
MTVPGQLILANDPIEINAGRRTVTLTVRNTGDRAAQIGSHFHFFEVNRALEFDRPQAMGMRLNILSGTSLRFEPGQEREVELVEIAGTKRMVGFNALVMGSVNAKWAVLQALDRAQRLEFKSLPQADMETLPGGGGAAPATPAPVSDDAKKGSR